MNNGPTRYWRTFSRMLVVLTSATAGCQPIPVQPSGAIGQLSPTSPPPSPQEIVHASSVKAPVDTPATAHAETFDVLEWSKTMHGEMARNAIDYRCQRIDQQILPELDRIQAELNERMLRMQHEDYLRQRDVIELVRKQWKAELKQLERRRSELE